MAEQHRYVATVYFDSVIDSLRAYAALRGVIFAEHGPRSIRLTVWKRNLNSAAQHVRGAWLEAGLGVLDPEAILWSEGNRGQRSAGGRRW